MRACIHDLETENNPWFGQLASPFNPDNYVVEHAYKIMNIKDGWVSGGVQSKRYNSVGDFLRRTESNLVPWDDFDIYVAHNLSYEVSWLLKYDWDGFVGFLKRGGRVYCTQLAHYLYTNQQQLYPALSETAPQWGGTPKVDAVKALWEAGALTSEIDPDLLHEYLAEDAGDIENTARVFLGTWEGLRKRGMLKMALVRMDALLFSAFCMFFGLKVDMTRAAELQAENEAALAALSENLTALLPDDMPEEARKAFRGTRYQLSAFLFGGAMKYKERVPSLDKNGNETYVKAEGPYFSKAKVARPESDCVFDDEAGGLWYHPPTKEHQARYISGKNKGLPKFEKYDTDEVKLKWEEKLYHFEPLISASLFKKFEEEITGAWSGKQTMPCGNPVISTSGDVLDILAAHGVKGAHELQLSAKIDKDLGSFYQKVDYNSDGTVKKVSGMLQYVQDDGYIHHQLNHTSTVTTRLSANKPNMQQLPRAEEAKEGDFKSKVKEIFVSRFGSDGGILQEDYSALETVGLQVFSRDSHLKDALLAGKDMHSIRLASMEELPYDYVVARTKDDKHPEHAEWDVKRTDVKPVAFQYQYGATAYGMAMSTGKSQEFCQAFIDAEKAAFPEVEDWFENVVFKSVEETADHLKPTRLELDDGRVIYVRRGTYQSIEGTTYEFSQVTKKRWDPVLKERVEIKEFKVPQMRNYPIQGGSGFFVQLACGLLIRHFIQRDFYGMKCLPINTVHDAVYMDSHKDVAYQAAYEVEAIMECIPEMINAMWPEFNCEVPFPVAGGFGSNMAVENKLHDGTDEGKAAFKAAKSKFKREFLASKGLEVQFD